MKLFEIHTGHVGESFERCYCWAPNELVAVALFRAVYPTRGYQCVAELFDSNESPFISQMSDCCFEPRQRVHLQEKCVSVGEPQIEITMMRTRDGKG